LGYKLDKDSRFLAQMSCHPWEILPDRMPG
jgi:hypothetical protein